MKKIVLLMLSGGLALMLAGCEKSAQEKLAEKQLQDREKAEASGKAYKEKQAKEYEELKKRLEKK